MQEYFHKLIGNYEIKSSLGNDLKNGRFSHAYIIEGGRECGKHTLAYEMCKALVCKNRESDFYPCDSCANCNKINERISTDISLIDAEAIRTGQVDELRKAVIETLGYFPNDADYKFYIIEKAEELSVQSQNLLLKSIEEPPAYAVFFFLCEDSQSLLETVRSRCRTVRISDFTTAEIIEILSKQYPAKSEEEITYSALLSQGSLGLALKFLNHKEDSDAALTAFKIVNVLVAGKKSEAFELFNSLTLKGPEFADILKSSLLFLRDIISYKNDGKILYYVSKEDVEKLARKTSFTRLIKTYDAIAKAIDDVELNVNLSLITAELASIAK